MGNIVLFPTNQRADIFYFSVKSDLTIKHPGFTCVKPYVDFHAVQWSVSDSIVYGFTSSLRH